MGLVNTLSNILHTPVVDQTGITGFFDFTLDPMQLATPPSPDKPGRPDFRPISPDGRTRAARVQAREKESAARVHNH